MSDFYEVYTFIFSNLIWINIVLGIILIFIERKNPTSTWLWLMVLVFLPGIGFILYLFLGQDLSKKRMFETKGDKPDYLGALAKAQEYEIDSNTFNYGDPNYEHYEDLIKMHLINSKSYYSQDNQVDLYFTGKDKFKALLNSIEEAEDFIHIQYYIFKRDNIGRQVLGALAKKALDGLDVRLLVDGMGGRFLTRRFLKPYRDAGVKIAIFLPAFVPFISIRINYRNHRKICIIDGKEAYLGGFNIGDEYLGRSKKFGNWRDTHIKIKGSSVSLLHRRFFLDWRFATKEEIGRNYSFLPEESPDHNVGLQIVSSGPDSKWTNIKDGYMRMVVSAKNKLYIETPYFIPDDSMYESLKLAGLSGVDVRVMIPNKPDHIFVYWAGLSYIGELLHAGVRFYTYEDGFNHSKVFIMDDFVSSVGTANLDIRSFKLNFEVNAFIYDEAINLKLSERFVSDLENCKEITLEEYEKRSNMVKIKESISRLLSPIL